jgi:hypothetical protein
VDASGFQGVLAPAGTPPEAVAKLSQALTPRWRMPEVKEKFAAAGLDTSSSTPGGDSPPSSAAKSPNGPAWPRKPTSSSIRALSIGNICRQTAQKKRARTCGPLLSA